MAQLGDAATREAVIDAFDNGRLSFDHWDAERRAFVAVEMDRRGQRGELAEKAVMESLRLEQVGESQFTRRKYWR